MGAMEERNDEPLSFQDALGGDFEPESETEAIEPAPESRGQLLPSTFLRQVGRQVQHIAEAHGLRPKTETRGRLAKFWFGHSASIHYEIWLHERTMRLEIGLHCESTADHNSLLYREFDRHMVEIQAELGPAFWLEEWDHGWIRLYETHALRPLDEARVEEIAERAVVIMQALEPIYRAIAARLPAPPRDAPSRRSA
jgi:hypothetical protein